MLHGIAIQMKNALIQLKVFLFAALLSTPVFAWHTTSGTVESIFIYASTDTVLVGLSDHGTAVPECSNNKMFAINGARSESQRNRMLTVLLTAKTTGTPVNIAYNPSGGCVPYDRDSSAYREIRRIVY